MFSLKNPFRSNLVVSKSRALPSSSPDPSSYGKDELIGPSHNDRRLRQAIRYLYTEGGTDTLEIYKERVHKIYEFIVQQYVEKGYSYDQLLYRKLKDMVRDRQEDLRGIEEDISEPSDDSDGDIDALYRRDELEIDAPLGARSAKRTYRSTGELLSAFGDRKDGIHREHVGMAASEPVAPVREKQHRYGGPENELEQWHKDAPPSLPFGETLYMQEWESLKIDYDLAKTAEKGADDEDPIVGSKVPYEAAGKRAGSAGLFDSGSRFKLPAVNDRYSAWLQKHASDEHVFAIQEVIQEFNEGGAEDEQLRKDYAPRIFLPKFEIGTNDKPIGTSSVASRQIPSQRVFKIPPPASKSPSRPLAVASPASARTTDNSLRGPKSLPTKTQNSIGRTRLIVKEPNRRLPSRIDRSSRIGTIDPGLKQRLAAQSSGPTTIQVRAKRKSSEPDIGNQSTKKIKSTKTNSLSSKNVAFADEVANSAGPPASKQGKKKTLASPTVQVEKPKRGRLRSGTTF